MLPTATIRVALPTGLQATTITILDKTEQYLPRAYTIYPAQTPQTLGTPAGVFIQPDPTIYHSTTIFPDHFITLDRQTDQAGQALADLTIYPLHYIGASRQLKLLTSITFTITGTQGYICGDYLPSRLSTTDRAGLTQTIKNTVINPDDVNLQTMTTPHTTGVPTGDYDYVIITSPSWAGDFQSLADWKTLKGIPATIVTTDWIYNDGGYSGNNTHKIQAFIQDAYTTWGATFFLLGGDTGTIPCDYRTYTSVDPDPVPNDTYYADFDGDWTCEVNVGRASVANSGQINTFINKILTYEQNPPADYATHAGFFGFDLDGDTPGEQCKETINDSYIPDDWTVTTVYDSQSGDHKANVIAALNAGQNLLNHADHSGSDFMGTGYTHHGIGLGNNDMDALTNGDRQGIFYSMGCDPCAYDSSACIAEHFVRNSNGGGIAFIGNSRYGWYNPGYTNTLSMKYDQYFFRAIFNQGYYKLGEAVSDHKNEAFSNDKYYKYCFTEITLLGDPELPLWTADPGTLTVTYPTRIPLGPSNFTVTVTNGTTPIEGAVVCLWKGSEIYLVGATDASGSVTFTVSPITQGTIFVTITKQNYLPSQNNALAVIGDGNPPATPSKPVGPASGETGVKYNYTTSTTDPDGDQLWYQWQFGGTITDWYGPYESGATVQASHIWPSEGTFDVKVKSKDASDLQSSWSPSLRVTIVQLRPNLTLSPLTGGLLKVLSTVTNDGQAPATNVTWSIEMQGGFILSGDYMEGTIPSLGIGTHQTLQTKPVLGLGAVAITVNVDADDIAPVTKTVAGFVLLFWVSIS
jgi:hypothetical protein